MPDYRPVIILRPLQGWEAKVDRANNRVFYVDHNTKTTSWERPRHSPSSQVLETPRLQHLALGAGSSVQQRSIPAAVAAGWAQTPTSTSVSAAGCVRVPKMIPINCSSALFRRRAAFSSCAAPLAETPGSLSAPGACSRLIPSASATESTQRHCRRWLSSSW